MGTAGEAPFAQLDGFFSCAPTGIGGNVAAMKKIKKLQTKKAVRVGPGAIRTAKKKMVARAHSSMARKPVARAHKTVKKAPKPISIDNGRGTQYDRQVFVRFDTPELKEIVRKAAQAEEMRLGRKVSLSAYIAHFAIEAAQKGKELKLPEKEEKRDTVAATG